jgi:hypothetical protein
VAAPLFNGDSGGFSAGGGGGGPHKEAEDQQNKLKTGNVRRKGEGGPNKGSICDLKRAEYNRTYSLVMVPTAVNTNISVFCSLVSRYQRFGRTCFLHLLLTLKMKAADSSEMRLRIYQLCHNPEDNDLKLKT